MLLFLFLFCLTCSTFGDDDLSKFFSKRCPKGNLLAPRKPTAKNNYTSEWCMGIYQAPVVGAFRHYARSVCNSYNSTLTLPETQDELRFISFLAQMMNYNGSFAIDGEVSPHCKAKLLKNNLIQFKNESEECSIQRNVFLFDDANTDPTYALERFGTEGFALTRLDEDYEKPLKFVGDCLTLRPETFDVNKWRVSNESIAHFRTKNSRIYTSHCADGDPFETIGAVLCGRHPDGNK